MALGSFSVFNCVNSGTLGVALLGSFTAANPTPRALKNLARLLAWKCARRGIDPLGATPHRSTGLRLMNISGHRDANASAAGGLCAGTLCPGDNLYRQLPAIRQAAKDLLRPPEAAASARRETH